jgi:spermidine synthase
MAKLILPALKAFVQILIDGWGKPDIYEHGGVRSLHFNGGAVQSAMRVSAPFELNLSYTRAMMGFVLFNAEPEHILLVGLGGGSLSKYCYRQFPQARITTLEINPDVIALRDEFLVPQDDARFEVVHTDACDYLARNDIQADVILLDGYDANGLPNTLCTESFYSNCWQALSPQGVLVVNLWGGELNRAVYLDRLRGIFDGRVWWCSPRNSSNLIVYAVKNQHFYPHWAQLTTKAQTLSKRYRIDLPWIVKQMRRREEPDS